MKKTILVTVFGIFASLNASADYYCRNNSDQASGLEIMIGEEFQDNNVNNPVSLIFVGKITNNTRDIDMKYTKIVSSPAHPFLRDMLGNAFAGVQFTLPSGEKMEIVNWDPEVDNDKNYVAAEGYDKWGPAFESYGETFYCRNSAIYIPARDSGPCLASGQTPEQCGLTSH
ncbi:MAG: hypothetical protein P4M08_09955 [Oligoflexia bacterium]|nr:hypothetical protein [Oligoflexia bacterium]